MNTRGRARRDAQAAASAPTSTSPDTSTKSKHTLGSETATNTGSLYTNNEGEEGGEGGNPPSIITGSSPPSEEDIPPPEDDISPLEDRLPPIDDVVKTLRNDYHVLQILDTPGVFETPDARAEFIAHYFAHTPDTDDFWDEAWHHIYHAMFLYMPETQSQVKKCKDEYICDILFLLDEHFAMLLPEKYWDLPDAQKTKLLCIAKRIGFVFVDTFESMITMAGGKKVLSIITQLQACLDLLSSKRLDDYFDDDIDKHVYYVAGYLCHAAIKASSKRRGDLGKLLALLSTHFVKTAAEIETLKATLPAGVTELVDKSGVHGSLTYPDRPFYSFVAAMEYCYAEMATPENLMVFGGGVLATICDAIADHEHFYLHFASLFDDTTCFSDETMQEGMEFIIKVYSNLRLKDLCRSTTVGSPRQTQWVFDNH